MYFSQSYNDHYVTLHHMLVNSSFHTVSRYIHLSSSQQILYYDDSDMSAMIQELYILYALNVRQNKMLLLTFST